MPGDVAAEKPVDQGFVPVETVDTMVPACHEVDGSTTRHADAGKPMGVPVDHDEDGDIRETLEAETLMPSIEVLVKMAERLHPPQSWFDEEIDDA
jgi:hypothetical protein